MKNKEMSLYLVIMVVTDDISGTNSSRTEEKISGLRNQINITKNNFFFLVFCKTLLSALHTLLSKPYKKESPCQVEMALGM